MNSATEPSQSTVPSPAPETATHRVLVNAEEQYCLWPAEKTIPAGWSEVFGGTRQACLDHVDAVWTDMRPRSVRD